MPHIRGVISEPLYHAPKPPKQRNSAMTAATAIHAITVPQAFGVVRKVAPEIFAQFKPTLAKLAPSTRDKVCEAAIRYAADVVADADVSESSHAEVAKRALTECLRRSLRYVAPDNVVQFPSGEPEGEPVEGMGVAGGVLSKLLFINGNELRAMPKAVPWFFVEGVIQGRKVSLLMGEDGSGKSFLMLLLALAAATGGDWLGFTVNRGPVVFLTAEEEAGDVWERIAAIEKMLGRELDLKDFHLVVLNEGDTDSDGGLVLGGLGRNGKVQMTALWNTLVSGVETIMPVSIMLDPLVEIFDGDEMVRVQSRQFIAPMRKLARKHDLAIYLSGHPSKTSARDRTGTAGSTGWTATMRGHQFYEKVYDDEGNDTRKRRLHINPVSREWLSTSS
jgi:hypothetical protein